MAYPRFKKKISTESLNLFLRYSYVPAPHCIFENTYKLEPGHYIEIDLTTLEVKCSKYWDVHRLL